jgi:hypothetical protein
MSTTIDQKVVEMRFDNKNFENNVSTTMSTLDKLKQKLNFTGASKGLEDVSASAKKVDMSGLASGVETVRMKFSALEVMGVTALANITNSAVNAGKRILSALTIKPVTTGFNEYELKMNSIQTIMASTGEDLQTVNRYLEELNKYSDETIYSFSDMTQNIGKFTNAGVKLEDAVLAIKGISNEAAVSGANANEASRAMYNFAQALSAGYVKLIDWKSIELANMATVEFKNQLIQTAVELGTVVKVGDMYQTVTKDMTGNVSELFTSTRAFNESLSAQWMTTDVLVGTLSKYADTTTEIGEKATKAATEVKTITQLWGVLQETAQSGWARTWELIVGDLEEAKSFLTVVSNGVGKVIDSMSNWRNNLLEGALTSKWEQLSSKIEEAGFKTEDFMSKVDEAARENGINVDDLIKKYGSLKEAIKAGKVPAGILTTALKKLIGMEEKLGDATGKVADEMKDYEAIVKRVINGEFGTGQARWDKLTEMGYDWAKVQNMVNERLGSTVRHMETLTEEQIKNADSLSALSDEQLKSKGYTEEQIAALRDLKKAAEEGGTSINELISDMEKPSGRELLIESLKNMAEAISKPFRAMKDAWNEIFGTVDGSAVLYNLIEGFEKLTESMIISDGAAENFKRIFEGLFAAFQLGGGFITKSLTTTLRLLKAVLSLFGTDLLTVAANVADYIVLIRDWVKEHTLLIGSIDKVAAIIQTVIEGVHDVIVSLLSLSKIKNFISKVSDAIKEFFGAIGKGLDDVNFDFAIQKIKDFFDGISKWIKSLEGSENLGRDIIDGLVKGLVSGATRVYNAIKNLAKTLIDSFCEVLGIHSPSKIFIALGVFIIDGLIIGLLQAKTGLLTTLKNIASACFDTVKGWFTKVTPAVEGSFDSFINIVKKGFNGLVTFLKGVDWGSVIATGFGVGMLVLAYKVVDVVEALAKPFITIGEILGSIKSLISNLSLSLTKYFKAKAFAESSKAILNMAIAIGILAGSVYVLASVDSDRLWAAVGAVGALAGMVAALAGISALMSKFAGGFGGEALSLLAMAGALLILSYVMQKLSAIDASKTESVMTLLGSMLLGMAFLMLAFGKFCNVEASTDMAKAGVMLIGMATAMLIMVKVIDIAGKLDKYTINNGLSVVAAVGLLFTALIAVSKLAGEHSRRAGSMLLRMSIAFMAMVGVIKVASMLDRSEVVKGLSVISLVGLLFTALIAVSKLAGQHATKAGTMILMASAGLLMIVQSIKQISQMDDGDIKKSLGVIATVGLIFAALIAVSKYAGQHAARAGTMLLAMSGALLILTGVMFVLSKFDADDLKKSLAAVTVLITLMGGLIAVSKLAEHVKTGPLVTLVASVAVLTMAAYALSIIEPDRLRTAVGGLSMMLIAFGLLVASTKFAGQIKMKQLLPLLGIVVVLTAIVAALSMINSDNVLKNVGALSALMFSFSAVLFIMSKTGRISTTVSKQMLPMLGVVSGLALIVAGLSFIDPASVLTSTAALSILMLSFASALVIMSKAGRILPTVSKQIYPLLGIVAGLALIVAGLSLIENPDTAIKMTGTLITLLTAFTGVTAVLSLLGKDKTMTKSAANGVASLAIVVGAVTTMVGLIGTLITAIGSENMDAIESGLDRFVSVTEKIGPVLLAFVPVTAALAAVGTFLGGVGAAFSGALAFDAVIGLVGGMAVLIGELMSLFDDAQFDGIEEGLDRFKIVMTKLGEAIGDFVGGVIGGIAEGALDAVGSGLSKFMNNAQDFINGCRGIGDDVVSGAMNLAGAIAVITGADMFASIVDWLDFGPSLPNLGADLSEFMSNAQGFITGASAIEAGSMDGIKTLAEAIVILTGANILDSISRYLSLGSSSLGTFAEELQPLADGLAGFTNTLSATGIDTQLAADAAEVIKVLAEAAASIPNTGGLLAALIGDNELGTWATQLPNVGTGISGFMSSLGEFDSSKVEVAKAAAEVIRVLAEASMSIPNAGGLLAELVGDNDLATWAVQLPNVATGINGFVTNLGEFDASKVETAKAAADVIQTLAKASASIPNSGGLLAELIGDNDLSTWAVQLPLVGQGITGFINNLGEFDDSKVATARCAADVIKVLAQASESIDGQADWAKKIFGDNSLATFSDQFGPLGTNIASFVNNLGTFSDAQVTTARQAVSAIKAFSELANADLKGAKANLEGFANNLPGLGTDIKTFCDNMPDADTINTAKTNIKTILDTIKDIAAADLESVKKFTESLAKVGEEGVKAFVNAFSNDTAVSDVKKAASNLIKKAISEFESKTHKSNMKDAADKLADSGADGIETKSNYTDFKDAGKYLGDGLIEGIKAKEKAVYDAAFALGRKAVQGEKDGQESDSPSKLTILAGKWLGEGLIVGMEKMTNLVCKSGSELGSTATDTISNAIRNLSTAVDTDIDTQPTIRPVLDLSNVESGVGALNTMFNNQSVGVLANVGTVSSMMNRYNQNGGNTDVVSAIDKLRDDFNSADRTTYNINGVTYDDGSNLRDAIETIIRYANIERRV